MVHPPRPRTLRSTPSATTLPAGRVRGALHVDHVFRPLHRTFLVSRAARERYEIDAPLLAVRGTAVAADLDATERVAAKINRIRDSARNPHLGVTPGDLFAAALIHELMHLAIEIYRERVDAGLFARAEAAIEDRLGPGQVDDTLRAFVEAFPPTAVATGELDVDTYLAGREGDDPAREVALEEVLLLWVANQNPALERMRELFDDRELERTGAYRELIGAFDDFLEDEPGLTGGGTLLEMLLAPGRAHPTSLEGQLRYIRESWSAVLGERFRGVLERLLFGLDVLAEERDRGGPGGPGESLVLGADDLRGRGREEYERFSSDASWMPRVVLLAKSTYVWLDQLSKRYGRDIRRLDQIPDEALDEIAGRGITGLWLIGLWQRSEASRRIKHLRGNPDAVASAYALYDYRIADDLGGVAAYEDLRDRAWRRGVRLASDMVPNHVGIDGRWVIEHPDWFISLDHPPYPGYTYDGPDLSSDERVGIFLEDHYYDNSDAAVVFKRLDRHSGEARYIYHGNDGTSMPWNDTAQIDYLNAEAREAVIQTILEVARKFPIIRFDAAMTLAKQHIQRLWYPPPGEGGAIPSRSRYGSMPDAEFDRAIPDEFWREVVDRVAEEVPDTLLLAEAFWMMEGYFVRTLGMHRVYNSAFMNMLKREENAEYRQLMKNVLEFDPQILGRFVNFMNNPDEETAVAQFGKEDKYFGVATLLATLPGLPMIGHGQIEGFHEKYGMEYRRAKRDEQPDTWLVDRHRREIFPLLHRRWQFAEVEGFLLYDLWADWGVNENVFAYSNRVGDATSLVVVNNSYQQASGWLHRSVSYTDKGAGETRQRTLAEGLGLEGGDDRFAILRDMVSGHSALHRSSELIERGLRLDLDGYGRRVFLDIEEVRDTDGSWAALHRHLGGREVDDLDGARIELRLAPVFEAFEALLEPPESGAEGSSDDVRGSASDDSPAAEEDHEADAPSNPDDAARAAYRSFLGALATHGGDVLPEVARLGAAAASWGAWSDAGTPAPTPRGDAAGAAATPDDAAPDAGGAADGEADLPQRLERWTEVRAHALQRSEAQGALPAPATLAIAALVPLRDVVAPDALLGDLRLRIPLARALAARGVADADEIARGVTVAVERFEASDARGGARTATRGREAASPRERAEALCDALLTGIAGDDAAAPTREFLRVNVHQGVTWFNKERFQRFARAAGETVELLLPETPAIADAIHRELLGRAERSGYRLAHLVPGADESAGADGADEREPDAAADETSPAREAGGAGTSAAGTVGADHDDT